MKLTKKGYMCTIAFQHELGEAAGPTKIYASLEELKKAHTYWDECGIVEVEINYLVTIEPQNLGVTNEQKRNRNC